MYVCVNIALTHYMNVCMYVCMCKSIALTHYMNE